MREAAWQRHENVVDSCRFSLHRPDLLHAHACAYYFEPHLHDTFAVAILTRGTAAIASARVRAIVGEGDVFIFNPFEVHAGGDRQHRIEYHVLYPTMRFVTDSVRLSRHRTDYPVVRTQVVRRSPIVEPLLESLQAQRPSQAGIESALQAFMRQIVVEASGLEETAVEAIRAACQLMHDTVTGPLESQMLAAAVGLSKFHFIRLFHRMTGLTPQNYLRQVRLARARGLICQSEELAAAAVATGFADQAHMTREFRKLYGYTPGQLARGLHRE